MISLAFLSIQIGAALIAEGSADSLDRTLNFSLLNFVGVECL